MVFHLRFEHASNLLALLTLPFVVFLHFYFLRHIQRRGLRFANFKALKRITGKRLITRNYLFLSLRLITLTLIIFSTAGPVLWYEGQSNKSDFVIAIDASASMLSEDVKPTRLEAAKNEARQLAKAIRGEASIGVVSFSAYTFVHTTLTTDRNAVLRAIEEVTPLEATGTDIPGALITSTNLLLTGDEGRSIILLSDGTNTAEMFREQPLMQALDYVKEHHTPVHVIGIGTDTGPVGYLPTYYNISARYDGETLQRIANATGGVYAHASDTAALADAFKAIATQTTVQPLKKDLRAHTMFLALFFVFLEWVLANTRFRALP